MHLNQKAIRHMVNLAARVAKSGNGEEEEDDEEIISKPLILRSCR